MFSDNIYALRHYAVSTLRCTARPAVLRCASLCAVNAAADASLSALAGCGPSGPSACSLVEAKGLAIFCFQVAMKKPFIYGGTGHQERTRILHAFKHNPAVNTVFLSKVGDE